MEAFITTEGTLLITENDFRGLYAMDKWIKEWREGKSDIVVQSIRYEHSDTGDLVDKVRIKNEL